MRRPACRGHVGVHTPQAAANGVGPVRPPLYWSCWSGWGTHRGRHAPRPRAWWLDVRDKRHTRRATPPHPRRPSSHVTTGWKRRQGRGRRIGTTGAAARGDQQGHGWPAAIGYARQARGEGGKRPAGRAVSSTAEDATNRPARSAVALIVRGTRGGGHTTRRARTRSVSAAKTAAHIRDVPPATPITVCRAVRGQLQNADKDVNRAAGTDGRPG